MNKQFVFGGQTGSLDTGLDDAFEDGAAGLPIVAAGGTSRHANKDELDRLCDSRPRLPPQNISLQLLEDLPAAVYTTDAAGLITYYNRMAAEMAGRHPELGKDRWCVTWRLYRPDGTWLPHDQCPMAIALKEKRPIRGVEAILERPDGTRAPILPYPTPLFDEETGELTGAVNMLVDISEHKLAARTHELLVKELHHRIKNTLANVQALAQNTLRRSVSPAEFAASFSSRLQALARAHSLLTSEWWQGIGLKTLIFDQLQIGESGKDRLSVCGPAIRLEPEMALHVAMLLHELHANAQKHGAYSMPRGRIGIDWTVENRQLHLRWRECGGPAVSLPAKRGFGIALIEQSARAHGGDADLGCEADGLTWSITMALPPSSRDTEALAAACANQANRQNGREKGSDEMNALAGKRVLVVEDEPLIALEHAANLEDLGMEPVGPVGSVEQALRLIESFPLDVALLDANLSGHPVDEIAAALTRQGIPFVFVTGYGRASLPQAFRSAPMIGKPCMREALMKTMQQVFTRDDGQATPLPGILER